MPDASPNVTRRVVLRLLRPDDAEAVFAYRSDPQVVRFQMWQPQEVQDIRSFIAGLQHLEPDTPGTWYQVAITLRESGVLIGDCGLHFPMSEPGQAEVGVTVAPGYQRQGYATEALEQVTDYLFDELRKHRVYARADPRNEASIALLQRVGMRKEGHLRESVWVRGEWTDDAIYAILEEDWRARRRSKP
jgi:RimJ/RimL family protein N-acetyltransferase